MTGLCLLFCFVCLFAFFSFGSDFGSGFRFRIWDPRISVPDFKSGFRIRISDFRFWIRIRISVPNFGSRFWFWIFGSGFQFHISVPDFFQFHSIPISNPIFSNPVFSNPIFSNPIFFESEFCSDSLFSLSYSVPTFCANPFGLFLCSKWPVLD